MTWKEVAGYEGLYKVSDRGKVMSLSTKRNGKPIILKAGLRGLNDCLYEFVVLSKNNATKKFPVHRLVAQAFIPNPENLPEVNHKDKNRLNNSVENLEWCTRQYNIEHSKNKKVRQIKNGSVISVYKSIKSASKETGIGETSITNNLRGWSNSAGGYQWEYERKE